MNDEFNEINEKITLAQKYSHLISLPRLSKQQEDSMARILEIANSDKYLGDLIEKIETQDYLESGKLDENKILYYLCEIVSADDITDYSGIIFSS